MTFGYNIPNRIQHPNLSRGLNFKVGTTLSFNQVQTVLHVLSLDLVAIARDWNTIEHAKMASAIVDKLAELSVDQLQTVDRFVDSTLAQRKAPVARVR